MNRKLPYEKLIAEKLQHLQLPDQEMSWQQMKTKLDTALPLQGSSKRGAGKWWKTTIIIAAMLAGTWGIIYTTTSGNEDTATAAQPANSIKNNSTVSSTPMPTTSTESASGLSSGNANKNSVPTTGAVNAPDINISSIEKQGNHALTDNRKASGEKGRQQPKIFNNTGNTFDAPLNTNTNSKGDYSVNEPQKSAVEDAAAAQPIIASGVKDNLQTSMIPGNSDQEDLAFSYDKNNNTVFAPGSPVTAGYQAVNTEKNDHSSRKNILSSNAPGTLTVPAYVSALPDVSAKQKALLREMKRQERKEEKELAKSYRTYHSFWGESTDRWFAAGIAPYQNIAVASQQPYHYNSATGKNLITDYIPSPYLQLHVTNRIYLLGEFQFNAPQATPSLLLSQKTLSVPMSNMGYTENIYLRKLYYFNMPVSFYYSPVKNFYVGSGLQFSSFNSGLADMEQRSPGNTLLRSETLKLKDDSLSARINGSEWRYLFDANYYYNRFMFGVRYNQALQPFVDLRINNSLPPTQARNQAFQLYIRYNLVVSDKKK
jgi:hypothetical protein